MTYPGVCSWPELIAQANRTRRWQGFMTSPCQLREWWPWWPLSRRWILWCHLQILSVLAIQKMYFCSSFLCLTRVVVGSLLYLGIYVGSLLHVVWVTNMTGDTCSQYIRRICHRTLDPCGRHLFWLNFIYDKIIANLVIERYCHTLATHHIICEDGLIVWYWRRLNGLRENPSE